MKHSTFILILFLVKFTIINTDEVVDGNNANKDMQTTGGGVSSKAEAESQTVEGLLECPVCLEKFNETKFAKLSTCAHSCCFDCFLLYLCIEIFESPANITCPVCSEEMHPSDIKSLLNNPALCDKYEDFMVRRVLAADPDTRYCPAPDCSYAVIAAGCAKCPKIKCERPGCDSYFCYHCRAAWHPYHTCASKFYSLDLSSTKDIIPCPRCQMLIIKIDGCNHMKCTLCGAKFCWLCKKEVVIFHYASLSGCTLNGKKILSRKKTLLSHLCTLIAFPFKLTGYCVIVAVFEISTIVVGVTRSLMYKMFSNLKRLKRNRANGGVLSLNEKFPVNGFLECPLCLKIYYERKFAKLSTCAHSFCFKCFRKYLKIEISQSRVGITCPECSEAMHPSDIKSLLNNPALYDKYEDLMVRREVRQDKATGDKYAKGKMKATIVGTESGDDSGNDSGDDSEAESLSLLKKAVYN